MPGKLSHEEISGRFLESGALNFDAVGKFVTELGPALVTEDDGLHGVIVGKFNTLACFLRVEDVNRILGGRGFAGLAEAIQVGPGR